VLSGEAKKGEAAALEILPDDEEDADGLPKRFGVGEMLSSGDEPAGDLVETIQDEASGMPAPRACCASWGTEASRGRGEGWGGVRALDENEVWGVGRVDSAGCDPGGVIELYVMVLLPLLAEAVTLPVITTPPFPPDCVEMIEPDSFSPPSMSTSDWCLPLLHNTPCFTLLSCVSSAAAPFDPATSPTAPRPAENESPPYCLNEESASGEWGRERDVGEE